MPRDADEAEQTAERMALLTLTAADLITLLQAVMWAPGDRQDGRPPGGPRG